MFDSLRNDIEFLAYCGLGYLAVVALTRKIWCHVPFVEGLDPSCKSKISWGWTPYFGRGAPSTGGDTPNQQPKPPYKSDPDYHPPAPVPAPNAPKCAPGHRTICIYTPTGWEHPLAMSNPRDCKEEFKYQCDTGRAPAFCVDTNDIKIRCAEIEV